MRKPTDVRYIIKRDFIYANGLSIAETASRIHMSSTDLGRIVYGRKALRPIEAVKLAILFGKEPGYFLSKETKHLAKRTVKSHWQTLCLIRPIGKAVEGSVKTVIRRRNEE